MTPSSPAVEPRFVVATPARSVCDHNARALEQAGALRLLALGTRRGTAGVPPERTRLNPLVGLAAYAAAKTLPQFQAESLRFRLHPWFDRWVLQQLRPGDHVISSYGYANACFAWARRHGGKTFLDAGNSHPEHFWSLLEEEHRRWNCTLPPVARHHYDRARAMMAEVDYVLSPSRFVTGSFLDRGFKPAQILRNVYPLDLTVFQPAAERPKNRPLTVISTGALTLRKGTPYLLEAFRLLRQRHPSVRLRLMRIVHDTVRAILPDYRDLPIEWLAPVPRTALAAQLREADVFVLPSLEDGFALTVAEALACGLPAIVTPNTGAADLITPGKNGEIVPVRDAGAIATAVLAWGDRILASGTPPRSMLDGDLLSEEHFTGLFLSQLRNIGLLPQK